MKNDIKAIEWFLDFFGKIKPDRWTRGAQTGRLNGKITHCAMGHLYANNRGKNGPVYNVLLLGEIIKPIAEEFYELSSTSAGNCIATVNDKASERLTGEDDHPKSRIMTVLKLALKRAKRETIL
jgi:hypothetical protein